MTESRGKKEIDTVATTAENTATTTCDRHSCDTEAIGKLYKTN